MSMQLDLRHPAAAGRARFVKSCQPPPGNEYDLLACLADAAAAAPDACPAQQVGVAQPPDDALRSANGARPSPTPPMDTDIAGGGASMLSEREVRVVCNGNFGTFMLHTQTVQCHCARCEEAGAISGRMGPAGASAVEVTPTVFERHSGLLTAKKWRNSIRLAEGDGTVTIGKWLEQHNILPRPKCNGGPLGSPGPGGSGNAAGAMAAAGAPLSGLDGMGGGHPGGPSSGNDSHNGGGPVAGGGGGRGDLGHVPALRSTLPPSRYPASEYVTGEDDEYDGGGGGGGGGGPGGGDEEDDEDYYYDARPYGGEGGGDGQHGYGGSRSSRRPASQRAARLALSGGAGSGSGVRGGPGSRVPPGHGRPRSRHTAGRGGGGGGGQLRRSVPGAGGGECMGSGGGSPAGTQPRGSGVGGDTQRAGRGSSSQEGGDGGGGGGGGGRAQGPGGHSSSEGSPPSPSDESKPRDGSGGSGEGDGSGTGDGGESRLPPAGGEMEGEPKQEDGADPQACRRVNHHPAPGAKPPLPPAQHLLPPGCGREGSADARIHQDRSGRHAAAAKRLPAGYPTGEEVGPAAKRARSTRPFAGAVNSGGGDELAALYDAAAVVPQVNGWRFMGPAAGPAAEQVLISVNINGRTYTGLLAPQLPVPPPPALPPSRPPMVLPFGAGAPAGTCFPPGAGRRPVPSRGLGAGPSGADWSLPPQGPLGHLGAAEMAHPMAVDVAAAAAAAASSPPLEDEPHDDGLPVDCPRCALCHRCAAPVLALPPPPLPLPPPPALAAAGTRTPSGELPPIEPSAAEVVAGASPLLPVPGADAGGPGVKPEAAAGGPEAGDEKADEAAPLVPQRLPSCPADASASKAPAAATAADAAAEGVASGGTEEASAVCAADGGSATNAASTVSAPSGPAASATDVVSSAGAPAAVDGAAGDAGGPAAAAASAEAEAGLPALPGAHASGNAAASVPLVAAPAPEVKHEDLAAAVVVKAQELVSVKEEALVAAAAPGAAGAAAAAAEASRTCRQAGAGLGPLVEVKVGAGAAPLLVHSQCALWSPDVFVIANAMYGVQAVVKRCRGRRCAHCGRSGATLSCSNAKCGRTYHLPCAMEAGTLLVAEPFSMACPDHAATLHTHAHGHGHPHTHAHTPSCRTPRPTAAHSQSVDASQTTTTCSGATATATANAATTATVSAGRQHQPQPQVELPASLQHSVGRRVAMPPPSALPHRSASEPGAGAGRSVASPPALPPLPQLPPVRCTDVSGLPALMMLRGQPGGGAAAAASPKAAAAAAACMPPPARVVSPKAAAAPSSAAAADGQGNGEECGAPDAKRPRLAFSDDGTMQPPGVSYDRPQATTRAAATLAALHGGTEPAAAAPNSADPLVAGGAVQGQGGYLPKRRREGGSDGGAADGGDVGEMCMAASRRTPPLGPGGMPAVFMARASAAAAATGGGGGVGDVDLSQAAAFALLQQQQQQQFDQGIGGGVDAAGMAWQDSGVQALLLAQAQGQRIAAAGACGGEVSVESPFLMNPPRGMPGGGGRPRHHHHHHHHHHHPPAAAPGVSAASTASGSTATTLCRTSANAAAICGGGGGGESPPHMQAPSSPLVGHVLPRAARNIEGLLPSRPLLHNPYVPSSGDPSADLALSKMAQNGSREVEAELLGGTTGRAGHTGRCAVCVIQRKGKCGTESAPKKCLRRQLVALQRATTGSGGSGGAAADSILSGGTCAAGMLGGIMLTGGDLDEQMPYIDGGAAAGVGGGVGGGGGGGVDAAAAVALQFAEDRAAAAAAEQRARERARRETWSLPLGQGSGATGKRMPQQFAAS